MSSRCKAFTVKMNCGCCEDVRLCCDLEEGHAGVHQEKREESGGFGMGLQAYWVWWTDQA